MHPRLLADTESARTAECDASSFGRRTHRSGKDTVEHPRNGHDDYANVVCGVLSLLAPPAFEQPNELASPIIVKRWPDYPPVGRAEWNHRMVSNMKRRKQKANT